MQTTRGVNNNNGLCECGCGERAPIATCSHSGYGYVKGRPVRYVFAHALRTKKRTHRKTSNGYIYLYRPGHVHANKDGWVREHVLIASNALGKPLPLSAQVHHVNSNRSDNRPANLVVCPDNAYHRLLHVRTEALEACGNANFRKCWRCGRWDDPAAMLVRTGSKREGEHGYAKHRRCPQ